MNEENVSIEETIESFSERLEREKDTVRVCSTSGCMQCKATMRALDKAGIEYTEIKLDEDLEMMEYVKSLGYSAAPVVIAGSEHWSGFRPDKIKELTQPLASEQVETPSVTEAVTEVKEEARQVEVTRDFVAELQAAEEEKRSLEGQREQLQAMPDAPWKEAGMRDLDDKINIVNERLAEIKQSQEDSEIVANTLPMKNTPFGQIAAPDLYTTDHLGSQATVVAHIFGPSQDWYISEYDEKTGQAFGWAEVLPGMGEYGYTNLYELSAAQDELVTQGMPISIELDQYWTPVTFDEAIAQHNRDVSPEPAHAIVGETVEPIQGFDATEEEHDQIDASFVETTYDLPSWYTLGDTYDTPDFSIANHVTKESIFDNDFWAGIETWRAAPMGVRDSSDDLPRLDEEIVFSARFESLHASWDIYDAAIAGTDVYVRAVYTDPNGNKSWIHENLSAIHESNPAVQRVDIPFHETRSTQAEQIENAIAIEHSRKDKNIPYAPLIFMGQERQACTRIADGIDVARYGEDTYTIVNFNTYRHLPNAVRENAQIVDGVHMWRDMTGT
ncbi:MAG: glutaredoxin-like protein NrdH, partial [Actinomycetaceae bacterium]|nr:glutaredoxin-like protein NrdH [Actinomycetaceae bacterium]